MRVIVVAPLRFPIRRPFAGGLESAVWNEITALRGRGHHVEVIATRGSDHLDLGPEEFTLPAVDWAGDPAAADDTYPDGYLERALPALDRALDIVARRSDEFDVVINHCLHGLPLERAGELGTPMVSTLHTPVVPELVASHGLASAPTSRFLSVSGHTARTWSDSGIESTVLHNAVDSEAWRLGPGGDGLVWFGRLNAEKAPHLALQVAHRLDVSMTLAGRIGDHAYFDEYVAPLLDDRRIHVGPLGTEALSELVGSSACTLVTPVWDEPFGLVTPESLLCGTPVAAFAVGGVTELAADSTGLEVGAPGDLDALALIVERLARTGADPAARRSIRQAAVERFSLASRIDSLEIVLARVARGDGVAA